MQCTQVVSMIAWLKPLCPCVGLAQLYSSLTMRGWHCHKVRSLCCSFECKSDGTYLDINHISLEKTDEEPEESHYTGPVSMPCALQRVAYAAQAATHAAGFGI